MDELTIVERQALEYQNLIRLLLRGIVRWEGGADPGSVMASLEWALHVCDIPEVTRLIWAEERYWGSCCDDGRGE